MRKINLAIFLSAALCVVAITVPVSVLAKSVDDKSIVAKPSPHAASLALQQKRLGDAAFTKKSWKDAAEHYIRAMDLAPDSFRVSERLQIAKRLIEMGQDNKAIELLHALVREKPSDTLALTELAKALLNRRDYTDAANQAEQILKLRPGNREAAEIRTTALNSIMHVNAARKHIANGDSYFSKQQFAQAAESYFAALAISDNGISTATTLSTSERIVSNLTMDDAMTLAQQVVRDGASDENADSALAKLYFALAEASVALAKSDENKTARSGKHRAPNNPSGYNKSKTARLYINALTLAPKDFDAAERTRVATWLTREHKLDAALSIIDQLILDEPDNIKARLARAKIHVALEQYQAAIDDADSILASDPENAGAALVRASALQKQSKLADAIAQYQALADQQNDFDARLGLAHALLAAGRKSEAENTLAATQTEDESQQEELTDAKYALAKSTHPTIDVSQSQYNDSDDNTNREFGFAVKGTVLDWDLAGQFRNKTATSTDKSFTVNTYTVSAAMNLAEPARLFGKLGLTQLVGESASPVAIGQMKLDAKTPLARMVIDLSRDNLTGTAAVIDTGIQMNQATVTLSRPLPNWLSIKGSYARKSFSDANTADDIQASLQYRVAHGGPPLSIGYGYHYMNFDHPAHNNYFDPQNYSAHQLLLALNWEQLPYSVSIDTILGHQEFQHDDSEQPQSFFAYVTATAGVELARHWTLEFNGEWGNSVSVSTPGVYDSSVVGLRLAYMF